MNQELQHEPDARPVTPFIAAAWTIAATFLTEVLVDFTEGVREGARGDLVNVTGCLVVAFLTVIFLILRIHAPEASIRKLLALRVPSVRVLLLSAAAGAGLAPGLARLAEWLQSLDHLSDETSELEAQLLDVHSPGARFALVVSRALVVPLLYELFFRGALFGTMRRVRSEDIALVMAAAFFAMGYPPSMPHLLILGLVAGWVRMRSESTFAAMAAHVSLCAVWYIPVLRGADPSADLAYSWGWVARGAGIAAVSLGLVSWLTARRGEEPASAT